MAASCAVNCGMTSRKSSTILVIALNFFLGAIVIIGTFPGWMSDDSLMMYKESITGAITNWHSPILNWLWSGMFPQNFGPIIPFLIQQLSIWIGITLLSLALLESIGPYAIVLPLTAFSMDQFWMGAWIWKDSSEVAVICLSLGLMSVIPIIERRKPQIALFASSIFLLNFLIAIRWYLIPVAIIATFCLFKYVKKLALFNDFDPKRKILRKNPLLIFTICTVFFSFSISFLTQQFIIKPTSINTGSAVFIQDILTVDCLGRKTEKNFTRLPKNLVITGSGNICDYVTLSNLGSTFEAPSGHTRITFITNQRDDAKLRRLWFESLDQDWIAIAKGKMNFLSIALFDTNTRIPSIKELLRLSNESTTNSIGSGDKIGWKASSNMVLILARVPSEIAQRVIIPSGFLFIVVIPALTLLFLRTQKKKIEPWMFLGLTLPMLMTFEYSLISAWAYDIPRYLAPANAWSILFSFLVLNYVFQRSNKERTI